MLRGVRVYLVIALLALATAAGALAGVSPKPGRYAPKCPQGYMSACGEGAFAVLPGGHKLANNSTVPWPNNPASPGIGICGRYNPFIAQKIAIKNGRFSWFSYTGTAKDPQGKGHKFTWTGHWINRQNMKGTVKWAGCSTLVKYTAKFYPTP